MYGKKYTKDEIIDIVKKEDIRIIRLQFTDIFGAYKNVAITQSQLNKALNNECMFDGSSIEGFARIEESDMYLYPALDTFMIYPWDDDICKTARIICDVHSANKNEFEGDPRKILKNQLEKAKKMGFEFQVGSECEFFIFHNDENGNPTTKTLDKGGYFELGPNDRGERARHEITLMLEKAGFEVEASHHECAPGQHEIDFKYGEALSVADSIMTFKLAVKSIADLHNLYATFMPKPLNNEAGSGMHVNMSLKRDGKNVFYDKNSTDGLSKIAYNFIAGIMYHAKGLTGITNPIVNSYKRLIPGFEAPVHIAWSAKNRSPLIRIPAARGEGTRIELRNPDSASNPYLVLAICLAAGLDGIKKEMIPQPPVDSNIFKMTEDEREAMGIESIPDSLNTAIREMKKDSLIYSTLGDEVFKKYIYQKQLEWDTYRNIVSQWEIDNYLSRY